VTWRSVNNVGKLSLRRSPPGCFHLKSPEAGDLVACLLPGSTRVKFVKRCQDNPASISLDADGDMRQSGFALQQIEPGSYRFESVAGPRSVGIPSPLCRNV
jgi:hypothetical protein